LENKENKQNNFKERYNKILSDKSLKIENKSEMLKNESRHNKR
jgi:hypothetical protein